MAAFLVRTRNRRAIVGIEARSDDEFSEPGGVHFSNPHVQRGFFTVGCKHADRRVPNLPFRNDRTGHSSCGRTEKAWRRGEKWKDSSNRRWKHGGLKSREKTAPKRSAR